MYSVSTTTGWRGPQEVCGNPSPTDKTRRIAQDGSGAATLVSLLESIVEFEERRVRIQIPQMVDSGGLYEFGQFNPLYVITIT
jgi:hypothetical protein